MIQQIIGEVVEGLTIEGSSPAVSPTYIHAWKGYQNLVLDEIQGTTVTLFEPTISNDRIVGNNVSESYPLILMFLEKSELEYTPEQHLPIIDRMRRLKNKFIYAIRNHNTVSEISNITTDDIFNAKDCNLSGVGLQITVTLKSGYILC